jgi:hypothetical protein
MSENSGSMVPAGLFGGIDEVCWCHRRGVRQTPSSRGGFDPACDQGQNWK